MCIASMVNLQKECGAFSNPCNGWRTTDAAPRTSQPKAVHRRMDELVTRVGQLEAGLSEIKEDVSEMKPVTDDVKRWKLMGIGALGVIGIGGMVLGVTFADAIRRVGLVIIGRG